MKPIQSFTTQYLESGRLAVSDVEQTFRNTSEPEKLSYYGSDDNKHRVYVCDNFRRYLEAIDLHQIGRRLVFPVERAMTIDLDVAARHKGYR